ncbi:MAG: DUF554 domain-containing protein [Bulleidia sp.]
MRFGVWINVAGILLGGLAGHFCGNLLKERVQNSLSCACGISVMFIGIAGAMEGMLSVNGGMIESGSAMLVTISLALGTLVGELINIEGFFESFGNWLKEKTGNSRDANFVNAFVNASLTVCIGAMAIVGSIQDGIFGDSSILATKAILDLIIIMVMTCSQGRGCVFSAIPVLIWEGLITICASFLAPVMTEPALAYLSLVGSVLIFCVGVNLVFGKKVSVANMLPGVVFAVIASYLPFF